MANKAYTFDDLMLVPQHSTIRSRKEPSTGVNLGGTLFDIPIISAPMNTVTEHEMTLTMASIGAGSVLHRYMSIEDQISQVKKSALGLYSPWVAVGATGDFFERTQELWNVGVKRFCIDVANGHSEVCIDAVKCLIKKFGDSINIMAGNVCTSEGAINLAEAGVDIIRVGIGPGSMCTTRLVTGFGVPQLTAIQDCSKIKFTRSLPNISIVADGGIRNAGDIVKALAMGADAVMIGGMLAGTDETPGETEDAPDGRLYKYYHGMASEQGRGEWFNKSATSFVPEGSSTKVWHKGEAKKIVQRLVDSLKVGMSFAGARNLQELRENAQFIEVSENGRIEGTPNKRMFK